MIDLKRKADSIRAAGTIVEILAPFEPEERLDIILGAFVASGCAESFMLRSKSKEVENLINKMKPRG